MKARNPQFWRYGRGVPPRPASIAPVLKAEEHSKGGMHTTVAKPFLRWGRGKSHQDLELILPTFPAVIKNYHEPFLGDGSVLIAILARRAAGAITINGSVTASDKNPALINLYRTTQIAPEELITAVTALEEGFVSAGDAREKYYYAVRGRYNALQGTQKEGVAAAAMALFLNKTCFRGVFRENKKGEFNVPYGNYKTFQIIDPDAIRACSRLFQGVNFLVSDFFLRMARVGAGDCVYLDPPAAPGPGMTPETQEILFKEARSLRARGASAIMCVTAPVPPLFSATDYKVTSLTKANDLLISG